MPKRNLAQIAVEKEATPGTAETLAAADVLVKPRSGYAIEPEYEMLELEEIGDVSSQRPALVGQQLQRFPSLSYVLRGPGDLVTAPAAADLLEAAMFAGSGNAETIAIGAITVAPAFLAGEIITGGTSGATGIVLQETADGAATLPYLLLTGTFTTEVITGGDSGATATSSAGPIAGGYALRPADWDSGSAHHVTIMGIVGGGTTGYQWTARGALADVQFEFTRNGACIVTQNFVGALQSNGDQNLFSVDPYPESTVTVPVFLTPSLFIDTVQPDGIRNVVLNWPTDPVPVEDVKSTGGIRYMDYTRGAGSPKPTVSLEFDQAATGTYDYFATLEAGTTVRFELTHGAGGAAGTKWTFAAPAAQFRDLRPSEREPNRSVWAAVLELTGVRNEELLIWQH